MHVVRLQRPAYRACQLTCRFLHSCAKRAFHSSTSRHAPFANLRLHKDRRPAAVLPPPVSPLLTGLDDEPLAPHQEQLRHVKQQADSRKLAHHARHAQNRLNKQRQQQHYQHNQPQQSHPHAAPQTGPRHVRFAGSHQQRPQPAGPAETVNPLYHLVTPTRPSFIPATAMPPLLASDLRPIVQTTKPRFIDEVSTDPYWAAVPSLDSLRSGRFGTFTPPTRDHRLIKLAASAGLAVAASTSSSTPLLTHCCYAVLGREGGVDVSLLGSDYANMRRNFTFTATAPASVILRRRWVDAQGHVVERCLSRAAMEAGEVVADGASGCTSVWAVDRLQGVRDRTFVLSELGQAMERMFTMEPADFQAAFVKPTPDADVTAAASSPPSPFTPPTQQYSYLSTGTQLIRAQLDCHDPSLTSPPSPVFDIKTRATHAIRYNLDRYLEQTGYHIRQLTGLTHSFEREYYDMGRSAFLKYALQCRIGGMQGVMVAFHNTERVYGLQMISVAEMERLIMGQHSQLLGDRVYAASLQMLDTIYQRVTERVRSDAVRANRAGIGGLEEAMKVTLARNVWDQRTMSVYVELSGPPADDFDIDLPFSHRHHTVWRLDVLDLPGLQSIAAEHGLTELVALEDRSALLAALEIELTRINSRHAPSVEHLMRLVTTGRLLRYRVTVQHALHGRLVERWNDLTPQQISSLQTSYDIREQRPDGDVYVRRMATEYKVALIEGRLYVEVEEEGEWDLEEGVEAKVEQLEAKAVADADVNELEEQVDSVVQAQR